MTKTCKNPYRGMWDAQGWPYYATIRIIYVISILALDIAILDLSVYNMEQIPISRNEPSVLEVRGEPALGV